MFHSPFLSPMPVEYGRPRSPKVSKILPRLPGVAKKIPLQKVGFTANTCKQTQMTETNPPGGARTSNVKPLNLKPQVSQLPRVDIVEYLPDGVRFGFRADVAFAVDADGY